MDVCMVVRGQLGGGRRGWGTRTVFAWEERLPFEHLGEDAGDLSALENPQSVEEINLVSKKA